MHRSVAIIVLVGATLFLGSAHARAACNLKTVDVPVKMDGLRPLVSVRVDGQEARFLLDSGAFYNSINAKLATKQKLKPAPVLTTGSLFPTAGATRMTGAAGADRTAAVVIAPSFEFAGQAYRNVPFVSLTDFGNADGILGQNYLREVDVEYDLGHGMLRLVQPQGCGGGNMAYWVKPGMSYSIMPIEVIGNTVNAHTIGQITINGVKMRAYFDTGAATSFITEHAADRAGVKTTDPGVTQVGSSRGIDQRDMKTWVAHFSSIGIGDEEIKNTELRIAQSEAFDFDVLVGADFFLSHHIYVANSQHKLYFTYGGGQVFNVRSSVTSAESKPSGGQGAKPAE